MTTIHAQLTHATTILELVHSLLLALMTTTLAQLTGVIPQLEQFTTIKLFVMTRILALTNLAILKPDVSSLMLEQRIVMTTMSALLMDALAIKNNVSTLL
jgi:hypothetical protein